MTDRDSIFAFPELWTMAKPPISHNFYWVRIERNLL